MKMKMIFAAMAILLMGGRLYAANGDLIVNGKVGLGTTSDNSRLYVDGTAYNYGINSVSNCVGTLGIPCGTGVRGTGSAYGVYGNGGWYGIYGSGGAGVLGDGTTIGVRGQCTYSGGIGVYGYGNAYDFYAVGPGLNYGAPSSIRWKKNIKEVDNALNMVLGLRGVYFDWDEEHGGRHDIGFIGEEVGKYIPEIVIWDEKDKQYVTGMDYSKMTPVLLEAIKEQQKEIETLKKEQQQIEGLKAEVEALKKALSRK